MGHLPGDANERFDPFLRVTPGFLQRRTQPVLYTVAVGNVALALVTSMLFPSVFESNPFLLFFAAVVLTVWFGGMRPGIVATILSVIAVDYFLLPPYYAFTTDPLDFIRIGLFLFVIFLISSFYESRHRSEQLLYQQREWFLVTLSSIGDAVIAADTEQRVAFLNSAAANLTGWLPEEALGKPIPDVFRVINERTRQPVRQFIDRILREGIVLGLANHTTLIARDGSEYNIADSGAPIRDTSGEVIGAVVVFRDVTEELKQEELLQQSEKRLRTVLQYMPVMLMATDETGAIVAWNGTCEAVTGYYAEEIIGSPNAFELLYPNPENRARFVQERDERGRSYFDWETEIRRKDGETSIISWSNVSSNFPVQGWASWSVGIDITERKKAQALTAALQAITGALSEAVAPQDIADRIVDNAYQLVGASLGTIILRDDDNDSLRIMNRPGNLPDIRSQFLELARDYPTPMTDAIQKSQSIWIESLKDYRARYPEMVEKIQARTGTQAMAAVPLVVDGQAIGSLGFSFLQARRFDKADREFILNIAAQSAQAMQRALLYEREQQARAAADLASERLAYLAESSKVLSSSLEYETTLANVAQLTVPTIADWCRVDVVEEDGQTKLVSIAHINPEKVAWVKSLQERYPPNPNNGRGVHQVIRTGQPEFTPEITDEMLVVGAGGDEDLLKILRELEFRSAMIVPLLTRGKPIGAMTFVGSKAERLFNEDDLILAQEVAQRAASAIDNARLYAQARAIAAVEERQRLARDLHDAVTQTLFSANLIAQTLPHLFLERPEVVPERLNDLYRLNLGALAEMRALLLELRPEGVSNSPLPDLIRQLRDTFQARRKMSIEVELEMTRTLPSDAHTVFYRITQEALNNIVKHAQASEATISLREYHDRVELHIVDNGRGFDVETVGKGFGLDIMSERAAAVGATLTITSEVGEGTRIALVWNAPNPE